MYGQAQIRSEGLLKAPCVEFFFLHSRFFGILVCYAATQVATQLHQRRILVVCSNKVGQKRLTESNGTPAMERMSVLEEFFLFFLFPLFFPVLLCVCARPLSLTKSLLPPLSTRLLLLKKHFPLEAKWPRTDGGNEIVDEFVHGTDGTTLMAPLVCIPDVIGLLSVWRHNKQKRKPKTKMARIVLVSFSKESFVSFWCAGL